jgi:type III secretion protein HrpB1
MRLKYLNFANRRRMVVLLLFQLVFSNYWVAEANTRLIFRTRSGPLPTQIGPVQVAQSTSLDLGVVEVYSFSKIRVVAKELAGSVSKVRVRIQMIEGGALLGDLDTIILTPNSFQSKVYEVPGTRLRLIADSAPGNIGGLNRLDVLIYGSD